MKTLAKILALIGLTSTLTTTAALGQNTNVITVDELGKGSFNGAALPSGITVEPFSGIATLTYSLPFPTVPGDVQLFEVNAAGTNQLSDVIRFDGNGHLFFFSEREATDVPPFDPADVNQFPSPIAGLNVVALIENGPEGNNGAFYNPAGGNPGDNSAGASYNLISDVPEPSSMVLAGLGGGLLLLLRQRLQARRN